MISPTCSRIRRAISDVVAAGGDCRAYIAAMGKSGYATDPDYGNKLNQILGSDTLQSALAARVAAL